MPGMVTAEIKNILLWGERGQEPEIGDPTHFGLNAQVLLGERGRDLSDSFDVLVCSPSWLAHEMAAGHTEQFAAELIGDMDGSVLPGAGTWLMQHWSMPDFERAVQQICDLCSPGPDWGSVASRISRLIPWEYDYRYDKHVDAHYGETFPPRP
ncbi:MAG: Imm8 family immunity protein [Sporichthyaceae bacterium]